jgi:hypothetical protein
MDWTQLMECRSIRFAKWAACGQRVSKGLKVNGMTSDLCNLIQTAQLLSPFGLLTLVHFWQKLRVQSSLAMPMAFLKIGIQSKSCWLVSVDVFPALLVYRWKPVPARSKDLLSRNWDDNWQCFHGSVCTNDFDRDSALPSLRGPQPSSPRSSHSLFKSRPFTCFWCSQ